MASTTDIHLVRVTTDDREHQLWVVAAPRDEAITRVLSAVPEGWTAALLTNRLTPQEMEVLNPQPGEVRENILGHGTRRRDAGKCSGRTLIICFFDGSGDQSFTNCLLPSRLASATDGFGLFASRFF